MDLTTIVSILPRSLKIMNPRYVSEHTKLKEYTTMIKDIVFYGCGTFQMTQQMKSFIKHESRK